MDLLYHILLLAMECKNKLLALHSTVRTQIFLQLTNNKKSGTKNHGAESTSKTNGEQMFLRRDTWQSCE